MGQAHQASLKACRQALDAGEGAPEEQLRVKNDREREQRGSPRR